MQNIGIQDLVQFGMAGVIFGGFLLVLKWVFTINHMILTAMDKERQAWQTMIKGFSENIKENSTSAREFSNQVKDAHEYQRKEHNEMILILGRINGYKDNNQ